MAEKKTKAKKQPKAIDKFRALGEAAALTQEIEKLDRDRDLLATVAAQNGATATEIAAVLSITRQTAQKRYIQNRL